MEKPITNKIIAKLNSNPGIWVRKRLSSGSTGTKGYPDITGIVQVNLNSLLIGIRLEIEVKQPGKKPTANQYSKLRKFRKLGAISFWCDSVESCEKQLDYWMENIGIDNHVQTDLLPSGQVTILPDL